MFQVFCVSTHSQYQKKGANLTIQSYTFKSVEKIRKIKISINTAELFLYVIYKF
jgi:hypothetical protein